MKTLLLSVLIGFVALAAGEALATENKPYEYPLSTCLSCGDALSEHAAILIDSGRELKFCCLECVGSFTKSPETYLSNLKEQIRISQTEKYPLNTCLVSGHELGSMGDPVEYVSGNTLVKFCCAACIEKFENNSEQMLKKLLDGE